MIVLLVDVGNTLIKIAMVDKDKIIQQWPIMETNDVNIEQALAEVFKKYNTLSCKICIISCVVPKMLSVLEELIVNTYHIKPIVLTNELVKTLPLKINVKNLQLGSDLIALAYGATMKYDTAVVVSLGTATTYNIVVNKKLEGVIIGPGFTASKNSLVAKAALLSDFEITHYNSMLGQNTNHALAIGYGYGFNTMIKGTVAKIEEELQLKLPVILTGGAVPNLVSYFDFCYDYEPQILFCGLLNIVRYYVKFTTKNNKKRTVAM